MLKIKMLKDLKKPEFKCKLLIGMLASNLVICSSSFALEKMDDKELSDSTGAGLGIIAENFKIEMDDTSYVKIGSTGSNDATTGKKAEIYLYGLKLGGQNNTNGRGVSSIGLGTKDNPAILKVYKKNNIVMNNGDTKNIDMMEFAFSKCGTAGDCDSVVKDVKLSTWIDFLQRDGVSYPAETVYQVNGQDHISHPNRTRMAVILDKFTMAGSKFQVWKTGVNDNPDYANQVATSGFLRLNSASDGGLRISADVRNDPSPTVGQTVWKKKQFGQAFVNTAPEFGADKATNNQEGMYWQDFDLNMPLGILGAQPVIVSSGGKDNKELVLEIARIPDKVAVYDNAYIDYSQPAQVTAKTCTPTSCPDTATHAELTFRLLTKQKDGLINSLNGTNGWYRGAGVQAPNLTGTNIPTGSAGLRTPAAGGLVGAPPVSNSAGTYSKFGGMFVQHLKLTTNAHGQ